MMVNRASLLQSSALGYFEPVPHRRILHPRSAGPDGVSDRSRLHHADSRLARGSSFCTTCVEFRVGYVPQERDARSCTQRLAVNAVERARRQTSHRRAARFLREGCGAIRDRPCRPARSWWWRPRAPIRARSQSRPRSASPQIACFWTIAYSSSSSADGFFSTLRRDGELADVVQQPAGGELAQPRTATRLLPHLDRQQRQPAAYGLRCTRPSPRAAGRGRPPATRGTPPRTRPARRRSGRPRAAETARNERSAATGRATSRTPATSSPWPSHHERSR